MDDPVFLAVVEQTKRVWLKHPDLRTASLAAIREKEKGVIPDQLQTILDEVAEQVAAVPGHHL